VAASQGAIKHAPHTPFIQSQAPPWESGARLEHPETSLKRLSHHGATGAAAALIRYPPGFACSPGPLACAAEIVMLAGSYVINDMGYMAPGAHAWRQNGRYHGPYGLPTGFMMFIRSVGGPLANLIEPERISVDYDAPYKPVLPKTPAAVCPAPGYRRGTGNDEQP
jgi:hypothetical protein